MKPNRLSWNRHSIVHKLLIAFLLVVLPLYILGISITFYSSRQMQEEVEQANISKLHFYHSHLNFELQRINGLVMEYSIDDSLAFFSSRLPIMSQYEVDNNLNLILKKLKQIRETSPYISDVIYYVPDIHKKVSVADGIRNDETEEWRRLGATMGNMEGSVSVYKEELYILRQSPFNLDSKVKPNFLLGVKLSSEELESRLKEFALSGGSDITLAFGSQQEFVLSTLEEVPVLRPSSDYEQSEEEIRLLRYKEDDSVLYSLYDGSEHFKLTASIPNSILKKPIRIYTLLVWVLTVLSLMIILLFAIWSYRAIHRPIRVLVRRFEMTEQGQTGMAIVHTRKDEFGYLYLRYNEMLRRLHTLIEENYIQRIRTGEAELKHLQSQITPHFLYNSLFSIKQMAEVENVELIKEFTDYLGRYFRYMTRDFAQEVTLGQELDHALVYLAIQRIRFGSRIQAEVAELDVEFQSIQVPRVLLQPIIENVFEHGLRKQKAGGKLRMTFEQHEQHLVIRIEDSGGALSDAELERLRVLLSEQNSIQRETTGLLNVNQRLRIRFGPSYGLQVERSELGGLGISVILPRKERTEDAETHDC